MSEAQYEIKHKISARAIFSNINNAGGGAILSVSRVGVRIA
jgi:hypothetical protein